MSFPGDAARDARAPQGAQGGNRGRLVGDLSATRRRQPLRQGRQGQLRRRHGEPGHRHRAGARGLSQSRAHPGRRRSWSPWWPKSARPTSALLVPQQAMQIDQSGRFRAGRRQGQQGRGAPHRSRRARGARIVVTKGLAAGRAGRSPRASRGSGRVRWWSRPKPSRWAEGMLSGIFIDRPRLAIVISIVITLAGADRADAHSDRAVPRHRAAAGAGDRAAIRAPAPRSSKRPSPSRSSRRSSASTTCST